MDADMVELIVNCETLEETIVAASPETVADAEARAAAWKVDTAAVADAAAQRDEAQRIVAAKASSDPAFAALLTLLGVKT